MKEEVDGQQYADESRNEQRQGRCIAEYGDLYKQGVIDPAKVVRIALQDAASVAGLLVTTEAMVAEKPKKEAAAPTMPPAGGMGMDF